MGDRGREVKTEEGRVDLLNAIIDKLIISRSKEGPFFLG